VYRIIVIRHSLITYLYITSEQYFRCNRSKNLMDDQVTKWGIVTGIYGIFAMKYLLFYEPPKPKIA